MGLRIRDIPIVFSGPSVRNLLIEAEDPDDATDDPNGSSCQTDLGTVIDEAASVTFAFRPPPQDQMIGKNIGAGAGLFKQVVGSQLRFKSIIGVGVTITANAEDITISPSSNPTSLDSILATQVFS